MDDASYLTSLPDDPVALKAIVAALSRQHDALSRQREEQRRELAAREQRVAELEQQARRLEQERQQLEQACQRQEQDRQRLVQNCQQAEQQRQELEIEKLRLEMELLRLKKLYYGPRADRLSSIGEVNQMLLAFAVDLEARPVEAADLPPGTDAAAGAAKEARRAGRGRRNMAAFDQLPVTRKEHDLADADKLCPCCGVEREKIGAESTWQIEYIPGHFERIEHVQIKYACKHCEQNAENPQIELADKPMQPIDKGMAGPGLLAYVVTSKYADYLPLYRLENIFERNGLHISRATQSIWCGDVADLISPLFDRMVQRVLESHLICTDDTVMPMLAPEKTKQCRMWVYIGDQANPYNVFDFTPGRGRDGPVAFLKNYNQVLLADAYGGYDGVVVGNAIIRAGCWAHARRKFVDAEKSQPAIAAEAVGHIRRLYAIEERGRELDAPARLDMRRRESTPILAMFKDKLYAWRDQLLPKHPMSQAINYTLNQWPELTTFAADNAVPLDNNISEREMKRVVLNRKNSLFVGNDRGGRTAAILSSFTSTCRRHAIDPQRYFTQLLTNLPATPISQLDHWLPDRWKDNQTTHAT
jgi:transposase